MKNFIILLLSATIVCGADWPIPIGVGHDNLTANLITVSNLGGQKVTLNTSPSSQVSDSTYFPFYAIYGIETTTGAASIGGIYVSMTHNGGTPLTSYYGARFIKALSSGSYTTTGYGIAVTESGAFTASNNYGIYIGNQARGTNSNYGIYSVGGSNYFGGLLKASGGIEIGSTSNYFGGTNRFQAVYDDLRTDGTAIRTTGASALTWGAWGGSSILYGYSFPDGATTTEFWCNFQLPHAWKQGTDADIHIHISPSTAPSAPNTNIVLQLTYVWQNINGTNTTETTVNVTNSLSGASAWQHKLVDLATLSGTGKTLSSIIRCNIKRIPSNDSDNYNGSIFVNAIDAHIQIDSLGSESEVIKY